MTGTFVRLEGGALDLGVWGDGCIRSASLSADGKYRYRLTRMWDVYRPTMGWVMLNPSTADAQQDDQTIRCCIKVAKREGCGSIVVVNLFAYRATDPALLLQRENANLDSIGPDNWTHLLGIVTCDLVVVAWGAHRAAKFAVNEVNRLVASRGLWCLGVTADGSPRHPSRLADTARLMPWEPRLSGGGRAKPSPG